MGRYVVPVSYCLFEQNFVFNRSTDAEWNVPVDTELSCKVRIFNKAGMEVYSGQVAAHADIVWNGVYASGEKAAIGLHKVIVMYTDNKTCIYNVVVAE